MSNIVPETLSAPRWAGRVPKWKIKQLYKDDARGIHEEDLINDVAYTLFARCESMLMAEAARCGRAACPVCEAVVEHTALRDCILTCENCGWAGSWNVYRKSFDGLHLIAPGLHPFCREYIQRLPGARTPRERMFCIDWLIHRCHWEDTALPGQPGAASLIEGRAQDVNAFLSALSSGNRETPGIGDPRQYWSTAQMEQIAKWRKQSERRKRRKKQLQEMV